MMAKNDNTYIKYLILSIIFLIVAIISFLSMAFFFIFGLPIGYLFLSLAVWNFTMWKFRKPVSLKEASLLILLPIFGIIFILHLYLRIPKTGFEDLLVWIVPIVIIIFLKKIKKD